LRHEAIGVEEILLEIEGRVTRFEVTGAIVCHAVAKNQILSASGGADGIGLYETQTADGAG
jgi:hypothetical protein